MSEGEESRVHSVTDQLKHLPATKEADAKPAASARRLFGRERSVHELLGGGTAADIILWRCKYLSSSILATATAVWILFEWLGYHLLPVVCFTFMVALFALFVWSNAAVFLKRSPPPVPSLYISEDMALHAAGVLREYLNQMTTMLHEVLLGKDVKLFLKIEFCLWLFSYVGKWADFLTLVYIGVGFTFTVPYLYQKHEDHVDYAVKRGLEQAQKLHGKAREVVLRNVPATLYKEKKRE